MTIAATLVNTHDSEYRIQQALGASEEEEKYTRYKAAAITATIAVKNFILQQNSDQIITRSPATRPSCLLHAALNHSTDNENYREERSSYSFIV